MIKLLVMDVDGTLTDGSIQLSSDGTESKNFSTKDGQGIRLAQQYNIIPVIITGRESYCVTRRAKELDIYDVYQNIKDKVSKLDEVLEKYELTYDEVAYIGDDLNDLDAMFLCKERGVPNDGESVVKNIATYICPRNGGYGAVRDFIEYLIDLNKKST
jgi:3-deoxy-D-manno-octulosonate 8-phosphate phosphatase (KDO 8-P phosphatase)